MKPTSVLPDPVPLWQLNPALKWEMRKCCCFTRCRSPYAVGGATIDLHQDGVGFQHAIVGGELARRQALQIQVRLEFISALSRVQAISGTGGAVSPLSPASTSRARKSAKGPMSCRTLASSRAAM